MSVDLNIFCLINYTYFEWTTNIFLGRYIFLKKLITICITHFLFLKLILESLKFLI